MHNYNRAMLAKLSWRVVSEDNSLSMQALRTKYCNRQKGVDSLIKKHNASYTWGSIVNQKDIISKGVMFNLVDGKRIWF